MVAVFTQRQSIPSNAIATVHRGAFGKIELLRCDGIQAAPPRAEVARRLHFSLPLHGSFVCHTDGEDVFADPTAVLCTRDGESFRISHPRGGDQTLVITPSSRALFHLSEAAAKAGLAHRRTITAPPRAQLIAYTLFANPTTAQDALAADESLLGLFETLATCDSRRTLQRDDGLVRRTLEYIHDTHEPRLTLGRIAAALEVRASFLTHAFARRMGVPLYRYVMSLKLARSLHRLATANEDITRIALDLGFNSHSHFSAVFRSRYGLSPSDFRQRIGRSSRSFVPGSPESSEPHWSRLEWRPLCTARGGTLAA